MPSPFVHRAFDVLGLGLKFFEGNYIIVFEFCSIICNKDFGKSEFCYPVFKGCCMGIVSVTMGYRVERYIMCVNASAITIIQEFTSEESDIGPFVLNEDL